MSENRFQKKKHNTSWRPLVAETNVLHTKIWSSMSEFHKKFRPLTSYILHENVITWFCIVKSITFGRAATLKYSVRWAPCWLVKSFSFHELKVKLIPYVYEHVETHVIKNNTFLCTCWDENIVYHRVNMELDVRL